MHKSSTPADNQPGGDATGERGADHRRVAGSEGRQDLQLAPTKSNRLSAVREKQSQTGRYGTARARMHRQVRAFRIKVCRTFSARSLLQDHYMLVRRDPRMHHPRDPSTSDHLGQRSRGHRGPRMRHPQDPCKLVRRGPRMRLLQDPSTSVHQAQRRPRLQAPSTSGHRGPRNKALRAPYNQSTLRWNSTPTS